MMFQSDTFAFRVARPHREVYEYLLEPTNFAEWAFTGDAAMRHIAGQDWAVETSVGPRIIRFATRNGFGILDHHILRDEHDAPHPTGLRVVPNGAGTQVIYTSFKRPNLGDGEWQSALEWVKTDLLALQSMLEARGKVAPVHASQTVSLGIGRPPVEVYEFLYEPSNLAKWMFGGEQGMRHLGERNWEVETAVGRRVMSFAARNDAGVLDYLSTIEGTPPHPAPIRLFANGEGTELTHTFHQRAIHSDEQWQSLIEWVTADLLALKSVLES